MSDDMSDIIQKMSEMLKNNELPDGLGEVMNNLANKSETDTSSNSNSSNSDSSNYSNIDFGTLLKMKSVIDSMNNTQNDPRANLLRSLKPYLKPSRKEKVEQYIKLFSMGKVFEVFNPLGGEKKNDV